MNEERLKEISSHYMVTWADIICWLAYKCNHGMELNRAEEILLKAHEDGSFIETLGNLNETE